MADRSPELNARLRTFIEHQRLFFVATAVANGRINLSPKGMDSLRVLAPHRVIWLNVTGSGNETAAHVQHDPRMTLMFCAFEGPPLILRLYGSARAVHRADPDWAELYAHFPPQTGARQIFDLDIDLVQTSCGFGVPLMEYQGERGLIEKWSEKKGAEGIEAYWGKKNQVSLDGIETGILAKNGADVWYG